LANDALSLDRNRGAPAGSRIPRSGVLSPGVGVLADLLGKGPRPEAAEQIRAIAREEAVTSIADLMERRLDWTLDLDDPAAAIRTLDAVLPELGEKAT